MSNDKRTAYGYGGILFSLSTAKCDGDTTRQPSPLSPQLEACQILPPKPTEIFEKFSRHEL